ncbi:MAG TPA: ketopantoate reductase C-terminal domain-containing protein, partial [Verrucomicrobiae bacterium]|nr:ketopantoate reductase C-terminal domain-containing protein [Verrucomicrobiae bacterium]
FRHAGIPVGVADNLACAHWEKLVWNIPFNGLGVASCAGLEAMNAAAEPSDVVERRGPCLTTDQLLADEGWFSWVRGLMMEVIAAGRAKGLALDDSVAEEQIAKTRVVMGPYKPSTLLDFELGRPLELESLFLEPLRQARAAGVKAPKLARLCAVLEGLERSALAQKK